MLFSPADPNHEAEIERILGQLTFNVGERDYACTRADLIALGRAHDPKQTDERGALKTGPISSRRRSAISRTASRPNAGCERTAWWHACKTGDGASGLKDDDAFAAMRKELENFADIMFSGRPRDRAFWLGELPGADREFIEKHYRVLKPCLHGSDAHHEDETGTPEQDRFCWLKGDLHLKRCARPLSSRASAYGSERSRPHTPFPP